MRAEVEEPRDFDSVAKILCNILGKPVEITHIDKHKARDTTEIIWNLENRLTYFWDFLDKRDYVNWDRPAFM
ncbi:MAG: hypothetical protein GOV00_02615 [Candidatus Altiarchaeota archaeon]|nr:hypothetical protein [Candidatus Altiarchaeota archaeon]